jgi:hypothetical protein
MTHRRLSKDRLKKPWEWTVSARALMGVLIDLPLASSAVRPRIPAVRYGTNPHRIGWTSLTPFF